MTKQTDSTWIIRHDDRRTGETVREETVSREWAQRYYASLLADGYGEHEIDVLTLDGIYEVPADIGVTSTCYWDASEERHVSVYITDARSMAGYSSGPEYRVSLRLADGSGWLNGVRHSDRGDLMTDIHVASRPWVR